MYPIHVPSSFKDLASTARRAAASFSAYCYRLAASSRKFVETYVDEDELLRSESGVA